MISKLDALQYATTLVRRMAYDEDDTQYFKLQSGMIAREQYDAILNPLYEMADVLEGLYQDELENMNWSPYPCEEPETWKPID